MLAITRGHTLQNLLHFATNSRKNLKKNIQAEFDQEWYLLIREREMQQELLEVASTREQGVNEIIASHE